MRKNNFFVIALLLTILSFLGSCKKDTSTTTTTTVLSPNVFPGSLYVYSSGNDTTLKRFLDGKYNTIQGNLVLSTSDQIDYSKYLYSLQMVQGSVTLYKIPNKDLSFLPNLRSVLGAFQISACPELSSFAGLVSLDSIVSSITIDKNPKFRTCSGLEQLLSTGSINITGNPSLISLSGLQNMTTMYGSLTISQNPGISNLIGLTGLVSIGGNLNLSENSGFSGFTGLANLKEVDGSIMLTTLPKLTSLSNLSVINDSLR